MISALAVLLLALVLPLATPALVSPAKAASAAELEFVISEKASTAARRHSSDMGTYRFFDHKTIRSSWFAAGSSFSQRLNASGYTGWGAVGENIAAGQSTAAAVFTAWRNSSGHNANMLNSSYRVIGIGLAYVSGSPFGSYWTTVHPNVTAITDLTKEGVISGYTDGTFHPSASVLRMQFAKMIVLALGLPCSEADAVRFRDVAPTGSATLYPDNYIAVAYRKGITNGTSATTYSPKSNISRAQTVTMVVRAVEKLHPGKLQNPPSGYVAAWRNLGAPHDATVRKAKYNGLLAGLPVSQLSPTGAMTRAEVAQILFNMQTKIGR
jgi:hypothetical protein